MMNFQPQRIASCLELHVFEQEGGWHWGITVPRPNGYGFKVIAFSERTFQVELAARSDGHQVLTSMTAAQAGVDQAEMSESS
jgi:hypothetical protein